ncbi:hypothetical protein PUNSTDRAFT_96615 [Punctularia strigosozonata HHB-11173 SS5]|uniref:uncharacterized protein n=1 Tax=Punctularia strigosozonata (strain HHB-11173) TaxID=741275 RepID=UPI0004417704|nr:uncharacterized protein PUNSTDRAFT_96615 [Punctularia strigosozonata HHB-11173 SS5]EIN14629.1 hypothetical protein PUNSTDRAFT_96615 [Punctularia strigosozonata HHB-11173 SS5]
MPQTTRKKGNATKKQESEASATDYEFEEEAELDSDHLDFDDRDASIKPKKRKRTAQAKGKTGTSASPGKRRKTKGSRGDDSEESDSDDTQEVVGLVVQAPKTGRGSFPPGQISQNTLSFLSQLAKPECNDREWFKLHEPVYRLAEAEWKAFVEEFTNVLIEVDPHIPVLPPKDVIHRIYRDVRFSNDKTPYKKGFSASFSRSGRKGIFAGFQPGGETLIAAGTWCPGKNELATIRSHIQRSPKRLRRVISDPEFVQYFGEPKPHPQGERRNIFGMDDELKVAPKGIAKDHPDIDLLKCRSFAVIHKFLDSEVLAPDFKTRLAKVAKVMQPFVHLLNDMMTLPTDDDDTDDDNSEGDDAAEDDAGTEDA